MDSSSFFFLKRSETLNSTKGQNLVFWNLSLLKLLASGKFGFSLAEEVEGREERIGKRGRMKMEEERVTQRAINCWAVRSPTPNQSHTWAPVSHLRHTSNNPIHFHQENANPIIKIISFVSMFFKKPKQGECICSAPSSPPLYVWFLL